MKKQKLLMMLQGSDPVGVVQSSSTPPPDTYSQMAEEEGDIHGLKCSAPLREVRVV